MSHQFESGFFVKRPAWHRRGEVLHEAPTAEQAIVKAKLDWQVLETLLSSQTEMPQDQKKQLVRDRDRRILGTVNGDYVPLQNQQAFDWFAPFIEAGQLKFEAAGSLMKGQRIWILAQLAHPDRDVRMGDRIRPYLLFHNSHDGSTAAWLQFTPVRVVCANTLARASFDRNFGIANRQAIAIPHQMGLEAQLQAMQHGLNLAAQQFDESMAVYKAMSEHELEQEPAHLFLGRVWNRTNRQAQIQQRRLMSSDLRNAYRTGQMDSVSVLDQLMTNFQSGTGNQGKTLWDAYNAVTEWVDHQRPFQGQDAALDFWFGFGSLMREIALQEAINLMKTASIQPTSQVQGLDEEVLPQKSLDVERLEAALAPRNLRYRAGYRARRSALDTELDTELEDQQMTCR